MKLSVISTNVFRARLIRLMPQRLGVRCSTLENHFTPSKVYACIFRIAYYYCSNSMSWDVCRRFRRFLSLFSAAFAPRIPCSARAKGRPLILSPVWKDMGKNVMNGSTWLTSQEYHQNTGPSQPGLNDPSWVPLLSCNSCHVQTLG
jgi:hypothetical protein